MPLNEDSPGPKTGSLGNWAILNTTINPVDISGTVVGESPDCLLLFGTVVGENLNHVYWEERFKEGKKIRHSKNKLTEHIA